MLGWADAMTDNRFNTVLQSFKVKDDWPQSLVMSMGTLFLLCGLALEIVQYLTVRGGGKTGDGVLSWHPGLYLLPIGAAFLLIGYFLPRKRAK